MKALILFDPLLTMHDDITAAAACLMTLQVRVRLVMRDNLTPEDFDGVGLLVLAGAAPRPAGRLQSAWDSAIQGGMHTFTLPGAAHLATFRSEAARLLHAG
ncbi:MAG: hypothetical protein MUE40_11170 [Anaerolineae bacterium]|jgi:hypothetical protein|nr:hypothetical protein [Anaerolineae bacterium]